MGRVVREVGRVVREVGRVVREVGRVVREAGRVPWPNESRGYSSAGVERGDYECGWMLIQENDDGGWVLRVGGG